MEEKKKSYVEMAPQTPTTDTLISVMTRKLDSEEEESYRLGVKDFSLLGSKQQGGTASPGGRDFGIVGSPH